MIYAWRLKTMTNYERDHLNPPNNREPKITRCENCEDGYIYNYDNDLDDSGNEWVKKICSDCEGTKYKQY